jgi:hypothetical protein
MTDFTLRSISRRFFGARTAPSPAAPPKGETPRVMYLVRNFPQVTQTYIRNEIEALKGDHDIRLISLTRPNVPYRRHIPFEQIADPALIRERIEEFRPHVLHSHYLANAEVFERLIDDHGLATPFTFRAHSFDAMGTPEIARRAARVVGHELCLGVLAYPFTQPLLERAGIAPDKIVDCFPVVNFRMFHDLSPNGPAVMNIGAAIPKKRMEDFIDLAAATPGTEFNLYGVGWVVEALRRYNAARGDPVRIIDPVEPDEMPAEYKKHAWLVYTACKEMKTVGWPMAVAEAQASGVGVCIPNMRPDLRQYVGPSAILYESIEEVAGVIRRPPSEEMRQAGFEQARKSDIFVHKRLLTDLWAPVLAQRAETAPLAAAAV